MSQNRCPLCNQPVSQQLFEEITGVWKAKRAQEKELKEKQRILLKKQKEQQRAFELEKRRLKTEQKRLIENKVQAETRRINEQLKKLEIQKKKIQDDANKKIISAVKSAERRARTEIKNEIKSQLQESFRKRTIKLETQALQQQEKIKTLQAQLKDKATPQIDGLLYEGELERALKKEFPSDKITHTGKGGDILQEVILKGQHCGTLIYECKRVNHWQGAHVEQAYNAKVQRNADFAILVTNASKKNTGGFFIEKEVIVVNPGGVLTVATILRDQVISMARLKLTHAQKEEAVEQTLRYLQGAEFKNSLKLIIKKTIEMHDELKKECEDHAKAWRKRYDALKSVYIQTSQIHTRTTELVIGKKELIQEISPFPELPDLR